MDSHELLQDKFKSLVEQIDPHDLETEDATRAINNLKKFSEIEPPKSPEPEPIPEPVPTTFRGKLACTANRVYESETTRSLIKAGGAFAGVVAVVWATVHRDTVLQREALNQANQKPV